MKKVLPMLVVALVVLVVLGHADSKPDTILSLMKNRAEIVSHVKVLDVQGGEVDEEGVVNWSALCQVLQSVKGEPKKGEKVRFRFTTFTFRDKTEPALVEKGKEYVIFLKGKSGGIRFPSDQKLEVAYNLLDKWVGALPYHFHLVHRLTDYIEDEPQGKP
jgi:hypothetical protein